MTDEIDEAMAVVAPRFIQPELRQPNETERVVRTAGCKFLLPNKWKEGDVLDKQSALLLNTAFHTILLNRFAPIRQALMDNPDSTYEDVDRELQAFFNDFKYSPRPLDTSDARPGSTPEDKELLSFARPHFNKAFGGQGMKRADYEQLLAEYVNSNKELLQGLLTKSKEQMSKITEDFEATFGEN